MYNIEIEEHTKSEVIEDLRIQCHEHSKAPLEGLRGSVVLIPQSKKSIPIKKNETTFLFIIVTKVTIINIKGGQMLHKCLYLVK